MSAPRGLLAELFTASRPLSWINTAYPFAAAYLLSGGSVDAPLVLGTLFFLIPYNLAMYGINDVFDYESDKNNPRKGGVEGHIAQPGVHRAILLAAVLSCVPFVVYLVCVGSWFSTLVLAVSLFAVAAYSVAGLRFKEVPFLDAVTSSTHFSSPAWFGLALAGGAGGPGFTSFAEVPGWVWLALAAFFVWGCASQTFGAVQDIGPDREGGLASIATVCGARATVWIATLGYVLAGALMLFTPWPLPLLALVAVGYVVNTGRFVGVTDGTAARTHGGWKNFLWMNYVAGFLVTMVILWSALG